MTECQCKRGLLFTFLLAHTVSIFSWCFIETWEVFCRKKKSGSKYMSCLRNIFANVSHHRNKFIQCWVMEVFRVHHGKSWKINSSVEYPGLDPLTLPQHVPAIVQVCQVSDMAVTWEKTLAHLSVTSVFWQQLISLWMLQESNKLHSDDVLPQKH